jgi:putative spermidine/putrescine transport system ATP-binding protein
MHRMSQAYLTLAHVMKSYDGTITAVDDVSFEIARGEFVTLLGPSGSGKTTTLMMLAGFEAPTSGTISLAGTDLVRLQPWQRNIGMVFQNYALFPHMTVERNVAFPLRMRRVASDDVRRRVGELLELVGLSAFARRRPRELSGGQQQRVALARGLVFRPDLLLLDEPLGALDKNLREQMQVEIKRIHREVGTTMIYVTHDQSEAMTMSDRVAVFNHGRVEQIAAPLDIYRRPATRFVGEFIGESNFFAATVTTRDPPRARIEGFGEIGINPSKTLLPGSQVDLLLRPERIRLGQDASACDVTVPMTVETIINYGSSALCIGRVLDQSFRFRLSQEVPATLREGADIRVGWQAGDMHVIHPAAL